MTIHHLGQMTSKQVEALQGKARVAFIPTGPTEVHGPHLPLATDVYSAIEMSERTSRLLLDKHGMASIIASPLPYAVADLAMSHPGNTTIRPEAMAMIIEDIAASLGKWGFDRICVVSGHAEPANNEAIAKGLKGAEARVDGLKAINADWFNATLESENGIMEGDHPTWDLHAAEMETSQMLYLYPDQVDQDAIPTLTPNWEGEHLFQRVAEGKKDWNEVGAPQAYLGAPALGTPEKGDKLYQLSAEIILKEVEKIL